MEGNQGEEQNKMPPPRSASATTAARWHHVFTQKILISLFEMPVHKVWSRKAAPCRAMLGFVQMRSRRKSPNLLRYLSSTILCPIKCCRNELQPARIDARTLSPTSCHATKMPPYKKWWHYEQIWSAHIVCMDVRVSDFLTCTWRSHHKSGVDIG